MPADRDDARGVVADRGLSLAAVELVARSSFGRMPITLVDRARTQLRRFFSPDSWSVEDDASLSAIVGPGEGWTEEELAPGVRVGFGWRGGTFKVDVVVDNAPSPAAEVADVVVEHQPPVPVHDRTLGDTFEEFVLIEGGRNPNELRFTTGPGTKGAAGRFTRAEQGSSPAVAQLFEQFPAIEQVRLELGVVSITIEQHDQWHDLLLGIFDLITVSFVPPRAIPPDRQYERALAEIGALDVANPRDLARVLDAATSPDVAFRRLAVAKLETADPLVVQKPWTRSLDDSSRNVRRAAIRAMAHVARDDLRLLFERALTDKDACVRYYALRGLAQIGVGRAEQSVERRLRDDDVRVRLAAEAALAGRLPG
ncbi:MAG TPA: HEAT repeat domain-containing protein [Acidimicrobiia bacterium]|nr:HEAT repeat domain-containing protein [Acidimicrobiia bacterium]